MNERKLLDVQRCTVQDLIDTLQRVHQKDLQVMVGSHDAYEHVVVAEGETTTKPQQKVVFITAT